MSGTGTKRTDTENNRGMPLANTVAIVGDPGTGKTTFLLSFYRFARILKLSKSCWVVRLASLSDKAEDGNGGSGKGEIEPTDSDQARVQIDKLMQSEPENGEAEKPSQVSPPTIRCYVSFENAFHRMKKTHPDMLRKLPNHTRGNNAEDFFVFVDATSLLSGRLEDQLRYPGLSKHKQDLAGWRQCELTLGGYGSKNTENFGLYWQPPGESQPRKLDQVLQNEKCPLQMRFQESNDKPGDPDKLLIDLMTQPVREPTKRVRLLKDLLANLFASNPRFSGRIVCIDSLSAVLSREEGKEEVVEGSSSNRLSMLNLVRWLEENDATTLMACEAVRRDESTLRGQPLFLGLEERYLASGVIQLEYHKYKSGDIVRFFRILKMRGCKHDMRRYAYDLYQSGLEWVELLFGQAGGED